LTRRNSIQAHGLKASKSESTSSVGRPLDDAEFEAAISALEASTAGIEKQCQIMEAQERALQDLKARHSEHLVEGQRQSQQQRLVRQKAQLEFETDGVSDSLRSNVQLQIKQTDAAAGGLPNSVERVLEKDDRLLDGLQKLLSTLSVADLGSHRFEEVDQLCQLLVTLSGREIRARIDAALTEGSRIGHGRHTNGHQEDNQAQKQRDLLSAELREFSNEIDSLVVMAVDNQFRTPISRELESASTEAEHERARWGEYVLLTFQYLTSRLEALEAHSQHLHAHQEAVRQVSATLDAITAPPDRKKDAQTAVDSPSTPTARGLKPLRLVQANLSEPQDPAAQLLRHYDIRVNDIGDLAKLPQVLLRSEDEGRARLADLVGSTELSISGQVAELLVKADADVQHLLEAVFCHSKFGTMKLVDDEVQTSLDGLAETTQSLGEEMRMLNIDEIDKTVRAQQRKLME